MRGMSQRCVVSLMIFYVFRIFYCNSLFAFFAGAMRSLVVRHVSSNLKVLRIIAVFTMGLMVLLYLLFFEKF